ncbi:MAG: hypothetical protein NTX33_02820 [Propionibacteriales bacterium]|nr:hypothetical protein [Propionibacteriales bacterium]
MPDQLSDLLHRSVDDVDVPHPSAYDILGRGRDLRRRRRVTTAVVAAAAVIAVGIGGVVLTDIGGETRSDKVADQKDSAIEPIEAYRQNGAWVVGDQLTIGSTTVTLPGAATYLAQTSVGVVAQIRNGSSDSTFVLVRPDGTQTTLDIPADTPTINGDLDTPRVAWVVPGTDEYDLHVFDVETDQDFLHGTITAPGVDPVEGRQFFTPAYLDGDYVYVGTEDGAVRVDVRNGTPTNLDKAPFSVRNGVFATQEKDGWAFTDAATGQQISTLEREFYNPLLSPDGRYAAVIRANETETWIGFTRVSDGKFTEIPDLVAGPVWTPGGRMLSTSEDGTAVLVCTTSGDCERHELDGAELEEYAILLADYLNVG